MTNQHYDVAIIGAGMAGLSTAYNLIGKAQRVVICEQETPGHIRASSYGDTRMYRQMYSDPWLAQVARQTNSMWEQLEKQSGQTLRKSHGLLFYGEDWGEETIEGSIGGAKKVMLDKGIPFSEHSARGIEKEFPLLCEDHWKGLFEPKAGAIMVDRLFDHWLGAIKEAGFTLRNHTEVTDVSEDGASVELRLPGGEVVTADQVVIAAGPWTRRFLPEPNHKLDYSVWHMLWGYYTIDPSYRDAFPQWFNFQHKEADDPNQGLFYGFPCLDERPDGTPYVKVGIDWTSDELKHPEYRTGISLDPPAELLRIMDEFVEKYLVGVRQRFHAQLSPYTMSPDVQFCLDKLSDRISLFSYGSGQAFKFAPMIGACLAALATGERPPIYLNPWRLERLVS